MNIFGNLCFATYNLFFSHKLDILFTAEPKSPFDQVPTWYWNSLNMHQFSLNITEDQLLKCGTILGV